MHSIPRFPSSLLLLYLSSSFALQIYQINLLLSTHSSSCCSSQPVSGLSPKPSGAVNGFRVAAQTQIPMETKGLRKQKERKRQPLPDLLCSLFNSFRSWAWRQVLICITSGTKEPDPCPHPQNFLRTSLLFDSKWRAVGHLHLVVEILYYRQDERFMRESLQCRLSGKRKRMQRHNMQEQLLRKCLAFSTCSFSHIHIYLNILIGV